MKLSSPWRKSGVAPRAARRPDGKERPRGPRRAFPSALGWWRPRISGIFEGGATRPAGMHRRPNAAGLAPRAARLAVLIVASALLATPTIGAAHHSFAAEYDINKPCKMTGTVTRFDLTNPHSWIYIDVKDPKRGEVSNWGFETANPNSLFRRGYKKGMITAGMVVTIEGYLAKDGSRIGNAHILTMPDGKVVQLGSETNPG